MIDTFQQSVYHKVASVMCQGQCHSHVAACDISGTQIGTKMWGGGGQSHLDVNVYIIWGLLTTEL